MFLSKFQYDAVMGAMLSAEQPREFCFGPQRHPIEFAKLYNTLWVADTLATAIGKEKWWFKIGTDAAPVQPPCPTASGATRMACVLPSANTPPALESIAQGDDQWPQQKAASISQRDHAPRSTSEVSHASAAARGRRLVDAMTGERATAQTKEKITYNAYLKRRWVDAKTGRFVPPHSIGSMRRAHYDAMRYVDPDSGVRVGDSVPSAIRVEDAATDTCWRASRQPGVYRPKGTKDVARVKSAQAMRRAKVQKRAAAPGTAVPDTTPSPPTLGWHGTVSTPRPSSKSADALRSNNLQP
jgi:hypothetical protein